MTNLQQRLEVIRNSDGGAKRILGLFISPKDAAWMDEVMELVTSARKRRNADPRLSIKSK